MVLVNTSLPLRLIVFDVSVAYVPGINLQRKDPALTVNQHHSAFFHPRFLANEFERRPGRRCQVDSDSRLFAHLSHLVLKKDDLWSQVSVIDWS